MKVANLTATIPDAIGGVRVVTRCLQGEVKAGHIINLDDYFHMFVAFVAFVVLRV